jgi:hypothetical protein
VEKGRVLTLIVGIVIAMAASVANLIRMDRYDKINRRNGMTQIKQSKRYLWPT